MRRYRIAIAAAAAALTAAPSAAAPESSSSTHPGSQVVLGGCRQSECSWLRIVAVSTVRTVPEGRLRKIVVQRGTSVHRDGAVPKRPAQARISWDAAPRDEYAFCSTRRPAYAFPDEDRLIVHYLDLFDLAGYQLASGRLYMHFCHNLAGVPGPARLRRLGYGPGTPSRQMERQAPEAMTRF